MLLFIGLIQTKLIPSALFVGMGTVGARVWVCVLGSRVGSVSVVVEVNRASWPTKGLPAGATVVCGRGGLVNWGWLCCFCVCTLVGLTLVLELGLR